MSDVLLEYALQTDPEPLQASPSGTGKAPSIATLTLLVGNGSGTSVQVKSITLSLPVGANAKDLTTNAADIHTTAPAGWSVAASGGQLTLAPNTPAAGKLGKDGVAFTFTNVAINDKEGICALNINEETTTASGTTSSGQTTLTLAKWPPGFTVSELTADPAPPVAPGTDVTLSWTGSDNATYTLKYDDKSQEVPHSGSFPVDKLQQTTLFYLDVQGSTGEAAQSLQRSLAVEVLRPEIVDGSFKATPQPVDYGQPVTLAWQTKNADSCGLIVDHEETRLAANSDPAIPYFVTPTQDSLYELVAYKGTIRSNPVPLPEVTFNPVAIKNFSASAAAVDYGKPVTLSWEVQSAVSVLLDAEPVSGVSIEKKPTKKKTYTLTAVGANSKSVTARQTVDVNVVSVSDFKVDVSVPSTGTLSFTASWKASHATKITLTINFTAIPHTFAGDKPVKLPTIRPKVAPTAGNITVEQELPIIYWVYTEIEGSGTATIRCEGPSPTGFVTADAVITLPRQPKSS